MKVRLETSKGELVHETEIPPFNTNPEFIVWGNRFFLFHDSVMLEGGKFLSVYSEMDFGYALPDLSKPSTAKPH